MRALTLWQPYATAIAKGWKRVETRPPWAMQLAAHVGERIAIHAAKHSDWPKDPGSAAARLLSRIPRPLWEAMRDVHGLDHPLAWTVQQARGCVVATAVIAAVESTDTITWVPNGGIGGGYPYALGADCAAVVEGQRPWGDFSPGRVAVMLDQVQELAEPIPVRGYQRLWTIRGDGADRVREQAG